MTKCGFLDIIVHIQRKLAKPKIKKEPVTTAMLVALVESLGRSPTLSDVRLAAAALLSFAAFLRHIHNHILSSP